MLSVSSDLALIENRFCPSSFSRDMVKGGIFFFHRMNYTLQAMKIIELIYLTPMELTNDHSAHLVMGMVN